MEPFFRVLQYSEKLTQRLIQFFIFSILGIIFSAVTLVVVIPMLDILFEKVVASAVPPLPSFEISAKYAIGVFQHFFTRIINENGKVGEKLLMKKVSFVSKIPVWL